MKSGDDSFGFIRPWFCCHLRRCSRKKMETPGSAARQSWKLSSQQRHLRSRHNARSLAGQQRCRRKRNTHNPFLLKPWPELFICTFRVWFKAWIAFFICDSLTFPLLTTFWHQGGEISLDLKLHTYTECTVQIITHFSSWVYTPPVKTESVKYKDFY